MKTCIISFSSRPDGNCAQIAGLLQTILGEAETKRFGFSDFAIAPCGACAYECFADGRACPHIADMECVLLDEIVHSDMSYFILPNYCDYPCANYFVFNERSLCFFQQRPELLEQYEKARKRFIVVSNTERENFIRALSYQTEKEPEILFLPAKKYGKVSIEGDLLTSEQAAADIRAFAAAVPAENGD